MIDLKGMDPPGEHLIEKPFAKPSVDKKIHFDYGLKTPGYSAYLVKIVSQDGNALQFRGVDRSDPNRDFGPNGDATDPQNVYSVDLGEVKDVYRDSPAVYRGASDPHSYGMLFLSEAFLRNRDASTLLESAKADGPKWPAGAQEIAAAMARYAGLRKAVMSLPHQLALSPEQHSKFNAILAGYLA